MSSQIVSDKGKIYAPAPKDQKLITEVEGYYDAWRSDRRPHETQWFVNAAMRDGNQNIEVNRITNRITNPEVPSHKQRFIANRIFPKYRARLAKFLKMRPQPVIVPASTDREDKLNARATQKVLDYLWRKLNLEIKYREALEWSAVCGKSFWWYHWNDKAIARTKMQTLLGDKIIDAPLGDPAVEVSSAFEVLVPNLGIARIADQPMIMRVKVREVEEVKVRYKDFADFIKPDSNREEIFQYERQIANLSPRGTSSGIGEKTKDKLTHITVKELFVRPNSTYPNGLHCVVAGGILLKQEESLPYGFKDCDNPYPVTEFTDTLVAGRFYPPTVIEQLIPLQREYNLIRSKVAEQIRIGVHPKILVAKQHQIPEDAWNSEAGEMVPYVALPGIPPPQPWVPPNIAGDAWRALDRTSEEFDAITQIYPSSEGQVGGAESGFQTNLLQEAADAAHIPDMRANELAVEEATFKLRKMVAKGYDTKRLITIVGRNYEPEVIEFSNSMIDEHAEVVVQAGSGLPMLKAQRIQAALDLWDRGALGNPQDPNAQRNLLNVLELGELESVQETSRRDEDLAKLENMNLQKQPGNGMPKPMFYENHDLHYQFHTDMLKSAEAMSWPPEQRAALTAHVIQHMKFINPVAAYQLSIELGMVGIVDPPPMPTAPPGAMAPNQPPPQPPPPGASGPEQAPPPF